MKFRYKNFTQLLIAAGVLALSAPAHSYERVSEIYGDYNNGWVASKSAFRSGYSAGTNNMLGFRLGNTTYATGVDNTMLSGLASSFETTEFKAMPVPAGSIPRQRPKAIIGISSNEEPVPPLTKSDDLASYLTDGKQGLDLNSGIFDLPSNRVLKTSIKDLKQTAIDDGTPDIVVTQIGSVTGTTAPDKFAFYDENDNQIGEAIEVDFSNIDAVGWQRFGLYLSDNNDYWGGTNAIGMGHVRQLRAAAIELSEFNISSGDIQKISYFGQATSGFSDVAFIAYNTASLSPGKADIKVEGVLSSNSLTNGGEGTYTATVTNASSIATTGITTVEITVPDGLDIDPAAINAAGWTCSVAGQTVTCTTSDPITNNTPSTIDIPFKVASTAAANLTFGTQINNEASNCTNTAAATGCSATKALAINGGAAINGGSIASVPTLELPSLLLLGAGLGFLGARRRKKS